MQRYKNLDGNSGVAAYVIAKTAITVELTMARPTSTITPAAAAATSRR